MKNKDLKKRKKLFYIIIVVLCTCTITGFAQTQGDVNLSGEVDIIDALLVAQYYVGLDPAGFDFSAADVNCSGGIDIIDALLIAQYYVGLVSDLSCPGDTPPSDTTTSASSDRMYTGVSTWFAGIGGTHYGGCGLAQADLDTQDHIALNVQDSPGDYTTFLDRPISPEYADMIGMFNNGLNCGRWVHVVVGDYCNGINDGAQNEPFCRDGEGWVTDVYNGAEMHLVVGDSCHDGNAWCRDDPYHIDISRYSLNNFVIDGQPVGDMDPDHFNNRLMHWEFVEAPNYSGDIRIGFIKDTQIYWPVIAVTHLRNGMHGIDYYDGSSWVRAEMNSDMGSTYLIGPTSITEGVPGSDYRIRLYDADDRLINNGRVYNFSFPGSCGSNCPDPFNEVSYTVE